MPYTNSENLIPSLYYKHKGKLISSRVGSPEFDKYLLSIDYSSYSLGKIPPQYAYRPDLIANLWYGTSYAWWEVLIVNGIFI